MLRGYGKNLLRVFIEDKMNLALHTEGKKKVNPLVILGVRFTKLIINHLQSIHKFHKRPGSPLHLPYEEAALGYLNFSFKNTKKVVKKRTLKISQQLVDEFVDEGVLADEPRFEDEEDDIIQNVMEESLKDAYPAPRGPLPPVVLLNLQTPKKKNPAEQFIFQRRTPAPTIPSSHEESSSLYVELGLTDSETESDNEVSREGQAGSDPGKLVEGQDGSNPGVAVDSRIQPTHVVHAGPNLEHINLEENLKISIEGEVRLEEPARSAGTMSSMQNLDKELSFTNQFLAEKSQEDEPEKINTKMEVQSMVTVPIHQDTSSVPLITSPIIDLTLS
ncbi:hypothetical protein Tco_0558587 [Tanacetum coccineum]